MGLLDSISEWWKKATYVMPPEEQIPAALKNLFDNAPYVKTKYDKVVGAFAERFKILPTTIEGPALARTLISEEEITIQVDVPKVRRVMDSLEVVLGHEIFHASDAIDMGVDQYVTMANSEAASNWWSREIEKRTVVQEDALRDFLNKTGKFSVAPTRAIQNRMHHL